MVKEIGNWPSDSKPIRTSWQQEDLGLGSISSLYSSSVEFSVKSKRRKSIAAHHNKVMAQVKAGNGSKSQLRLKSMISVETWKSAATSSTLDSVKESSCTVLMLTDASIASPHCKKKLIKLLREGDNRVDLSVGYAIDAVLARPVIKKPNVDAAQLKAPYSGGEFSTFDWREEFPTKELLRGVHVIKAQETESVLELSLEDIPGMPHDSDFCVTLTDVSCDLKTVTTSLGSIVSTCVKRERIAFRTKIVFALEQMTTEPSATAQTLEVIVFRMGDTSRVVKYKYATEALNAVPGMDFEEVEGSGTFEVGETEHRIKIELLPTAPYRPECSFLLVLSPEDGEEEVLFDSVDDGGVDSAIFTVRMKANPQFDNTFWRTFNTYFNMRRIQAGNADWFQNICSAWLVDGSWEDQQDAGPMDWAWHILTLPWSVLFSFIPPTTYCGGWFCFVVNLTFIAALTAVIADLAELFGCMVSLPDVVTAITIVALGTSMPDLFASKMAAIDDPTADASIVNVTGSNSVNVFLGLGLPWTLGSIYWAVSERTPEWEKDYPDIAAKYTEGMVFVVYSGDLGFCTMVFCSMAILALVILVMRRSKVGAELGGPVRQKWISGFSLFVFWVCYVVLASWRALRKSASATEETAVIGSISAVCVALFFMNVAVYFFSKETDEKQG
eukprot:TRINITY_DN3893_c0_g1_i1.p1 TRINITY_DN3893_c0_g1~~TRINITY_DN3893_c0_g1_i1.p1  ORF type:complete len:669 (+),score=128.90 TRINITY_DN3893_c0_g1_i1:382-2388(+)